jgi:hypothetical protein
MKLNEYKEDSDQPHRGRDSGYLDSAGSLTPTRFGISALREARFESYTGPFGQNELQPCGAVQVLGAAILGECHERMGTFEAAD